MRCFVNMPNGLLIPWEEEKEERSLIIDLERHTRLAVAWSRHGSPVPRRTLPAEALEEEEWKRAFDVT